MIFILMVRLDLMGAHVMVCIKIVLNEGMTSVIEAQKEKDASRSRSSRSNNNKMVGRAMGRAGARTEEPSRIQSRMRNLANLGKHQRKQRQRSQSSRCVPSSNRSHQSHQALMARMARVRRTMKQYHVKRSSLFRLSLRQGV